MGHSYRPVELAMIGRTSAFSSAGYRLLQNLIDAADRVYTGAIMLRRGVTTCLFELFALLAISRFRRPTRWPGSVRSAPVAATRCSCRRSKWRAPPPRRSPRIPQRSLRSLHRRRRPRPSLSLGQRPWDPRLNLSPHRPSVIVRNRNLDARSDFPGRTSPLLR